MRRVSSSHLFTEDNHPSGSDDRLCSYVYLVQQRNSSSMQNRIGRHDNASIHKHSNICRICHRFDTTRPTDGGDIQIGFCLEVASNRFVKYLLSTSSGFHIMLMFSFPFCRGKGRYGTLGGLQQKIAGEHPSCSRSGAFS